MNEWYGAKELAGLPGMPGTDRAIQIRAVKEGWQSRPRSGRGGGREYHISSLPEATRLHLWSRESGGRIQESGVPVSAPASASNLSPVPASWPRDGSRDGSGSGFKPDPGRYVPDKARAIALARLDLVRLWQDYRRTSPRGLSRADREFSAAYNSRLLFPHLHDILGNVSVQTLYRWRLRLNDGVVPGLKPGTTQYDDWTLLVPGYFSASQDKPRLTPEEEQFFLGLLLHPNRIKIGAAIRLMRYHFERQGVTVAKSDMTLRRFAEDFKARRYDRWVLMREGQKALTDKVTFSIKRDPSLIEVGEVLVADGHRLDFQVINPFTGKPGRATMVGYIDWKSWDLVGYEIMMEENTQCIASAFRNAVLTLGAFPKVLYLDNGKAFRSRFFTSTETFDEAGIYGLFARLGVVPVFARPYNARAKVIERWFQEFGNTFERLLPSFTGASITDKPAHLLRNERLHKALHRQYVPTIQEAMELIRLWHDFLRSQPCPHVKGRTIGEVFDQGKGPGVDAALLDDLMMTMKITRIDRRGIRFLNADYYDDALYGLREQVMIRYSLFDLSAIKVCTVRGGPICEARRVEAVHPIARITGTRVDMESVSRQIADQKRLEKRTIKGIKELVKARKDVAMDWEMIATDHPGIIDRLEEEHIPLPAIERHIPEEVVEQTPDSGPLHLAPDTLNLEPGPLHLAHSIGERPFFTSNYDRYQWHREHGVFTEEDEAWITWYKTTSSYRMLVEFFETQQQEIQNNTSQEGII